MEAIGANDENEVRIRSLDPKESQRTPNSTVLKNIFKIMQISDNEDDEEGDNVILDPGDGSDLLRKYFPLPQNDW